MQKRLGFLQANFAVITVLMGAFIGIREIRTAMEGSIAVIIGVITILGKDKAAFRINDEVL